MRSRFSILRVGLTAANFVSNHPVTLGYPMDTSKCPKLWLEQSKWEIPMWIPLMWPAYPGSQTSRKIQMQKRGQASRQADFQTRHNNSPEKISGIMAVHERGRAGDMTRMRTREEGNSSSQTNGPCLAMLDSDANVLIFSGRSKLSHREQGWSSGAWRLLWNKVE